MENNKYCINLDSEGYLLGIYNTYDPEVDIYEIDISTLNLDGHRLRAYKMEEFDKNDIFDFSNMPFKFAIQANSTYFIKRAAENKIITVEKAANLINNINSYPHPHPHPIPKVHFNFDSTRYAEIIYEIEEQRKTPSDMEKRDAQNFYSSVMSNSYLLIPDMKESEIERLKKFYWKRIYNEEIVYKFVEKNIITEKEYLEIVGENQYKNSYIINNKDEYREQRIKEIKTQVDNNTFDERKFLHIKTNPINAINTDINNISLDERKTKEEIKIQLKNLLKEFEKK